MAGGDAGMTGRLHAVRHPGEVTAGEALTWFAARPAGMGEVIGYLFAPDRAEWFRCHGPVPHGPDAARNLTPAFEVYATDGERHLRWVHTTSGKGPAVRLAEDPGLLPAGAELSASPKRNRLPGVTTRLLAGLVLQSRDGWATLTSARYEPCQVPVTADRGQEVWARLAEYTVCDEHGNLSVVDTLLLGLQARDSRASRTPAATTERSA
jgi:hypothetical protein